MVYATELKPAWDQKAKSPNEYFENLFPSQTKQYGPAFFEITESSVDGFRRINPVSLNVDFFAATLSDERLGLSVVYFEPEMQFYYLEPIQKIYMPTSPEKLQNLYRGLLIRCAQELNSETNKFPLFHEFRNDKWAKAVTSRAKSILTCSHEFFSATSPNQRIRGVELHERIARKFVDELLTASPGNVLLLADAYASFLNLVKENNLEPVRRCDFKAMVVPFVQEKFAICLRNDLKMDERSGVRGWKNVGMVQAAPS